jgi:hypothetical protein
LLPLLRDNGAEFKNLADQADNLGAVMDDSAIRAAKEFEKNLNTMSVAAQTFGQRIAIELIPTLNALATEATNAGGVFSGFADFIGTALRTIIESAAIFAADVNFVFQGIGREIGGIAAQIGALARLDFDGFTAISDAMKEDAQRAKAELDRFQKQILNPSFGAGSPDDQSSAEARRLGLATSTPTIAGIGGTTKPTGATKPSVKTPVDEVKKYLDDLKKQLQATRELSVEETVLADIQAGRLGMVGAAKQKELQEIARQIDTTRELQQIEKDFESARLDTARATVRAREEQDALLKSMLDATPTRQLEKQRAEMKLLADAFHATEISAEEFSEAAATRLGNVVEKQKKANEEASMFGQIMTSAFEDAIIEGKKFSDVLKGLAQDLLKVFLRKQVTEPLAQAASGAFGGRFGWAFGNSSGSTPGIAGFSSFEGGGWTGNGARSGGLDGKGGYLAMVHPKERIIDTTQGGSGGATIIQHVTIDARGADAGVDQKIMQAMRQTKQETLAAVQAQANRGGSFASAVGRR